MIKGILRWFFATRTPECEGVSSVPHHETKRTQATRECAVLDLQSSSGILADYGTSREEEPVTRITLRDERTQVVEVFEFPGEIHAMLFRRLTGAQIEHRVTETAWYDREIGEWNNSQEHTIKVLTGELAGEQISGSRWRLDTAPQVGKYEND